MKKIIRALFGCFCGLLVLGCDQTEEYGLEKLTKGVSSEADVRNAMGNPEIVWEEDSGARTLEYPKGPAGHRTYIVNIDAHGTYQTYTQALSEQNFATITPGMTQDEVRRKLGKPRTVVRFALKNEEVWDWRYLESPAVERFFNVHFDIDTRKVTRTSVTDAMLG